MQVLETGGVSLNNKEESPKEFWQTFLSGLSTFLIMKKFGKSTTSFSQAMLKVGASFKKQS